MASFTLGLMLIAFPGTASAAGEGPVTIPLPNGYFQFESAISPKTIGRQTSTPVSLEVSGGTIETMGPHAPGIQELKIEVDRHLELNAEALPKCNPSFHPRAVCSRALIGEGRVTILLASQDPGEPLPIKAVVDLYNGGVRGDTTELYAEYRLPEYWDEVVFQKIRLRPVQGEGLFGSQMTIAVPQFVDGEGILVSFSMMIRSELKVDGDAVPVLTALCPHGKVALQGEAEVEGGTTFVTESIRACTPVSRPASEQGHQGGTP